MDNINASRSRGPNYLPPAGEISTLLTERPEMVRRLLFLQIRECGENIEAAISDDCYYVARGMARKATEKAVTKRMAELQECLLPLAQIGWR